jgi:hypothetical protein
MPDSAADALMGALALIALAVAITGHVMGVWS